MLRAGPAESALKQGKATATRNFEELGSEKLTQHSHRSPDRTVERTLEKIYKIKELERLEVYTKTGKSPELCVKLKVMGVCSITWWAIASRTL